MPSGVQPDIRWFFHGLVAVEDDQPLCLQLARRRLLRFPPAYNPYLETLVSSVNNTSDRSALSQSVPNELWVALRQRSVLVRRKPQRHKNLDQPTETPGPLWQGAQTLRDLLLGTSPVYDGLHVYFPVFSEDSCPCPSCAEARLRQTLPGLGAELDTEFLMPPCTVERPWVRQQINRLEHNSINKKDGRFGWALANGEVRWFRPLPLPDCDCWKRSPEFALSRELIHPIFGLIGEVEEENVDPINNSFHLARAVGPTIIRANGEPLTTIGSAVDTNVESAKVRATGECVERYAGRLGHPSQIICARPGELDKRTPDLKSLIGFAEDQYEDPSFRFVPMDEKSSYTWAAGRNFLDASRTFIPLQLVLLEGQIKLGEDPLDQRVSVGLGAGPTELFAATSGLLEVIERHSACKAWHAQRPLPTLDAAGTSKKVQQWIHAWQEIGVQTSLLKLPAPIAVNCVAVFLRSSHTYPAAVFGLGAALDVRRAAEDALLEASMIRNTYGRLENRGLTPDPFVDNPQSVERLRDRVLLYGDPRMLPALDSLVSTRRAYPEPTPSLPPNEKAAWVAQRLREKNLETYLVNITPRDISTAGYQVVRMFVPGLRPMDVRHDAPHLYGSSKLGPYPSLPHPFA